MSALGQKQTRALQHLMSALPLKADMCSALDHVRFGPKADMRPPKLIAPAGLMAATMSRRGLRLLASKLG